ncbi:MAG TPA: phosphoribosyltransferase family protein [Candidatus Saccharimonadales bacterium]|nr:phosphoribosyltransferase family protein [Candidatus Saccharimonadales bacterium]
MYFASRVQAGRMLANHLVQKYRYENCAVVALDDGGVVVGSQIAIALHCVLTMLPISEIHLPREPVSLAGITVSGTMAYNPSYSRGEVEEMTNEFRGLIEQEKMAEMHKINRLMGQGGTIGRELLRGQNIILVSDGFKDAFSLDVAAEFLKPIAVEKLIVAAPLSSISAVDRMHILADEIYCLSVVAEYMDTPHYYDKQDIPDQETIVKTIENIILHWQ